MPKQCLRCLLYEAGEKVTYDEIMSYVATINIKDLVSDDLYEFRISKCRACNYLISGMCRKCGCYVEVRARLKNADCPDYDDRKW